MRWIALTLSLVACDPKPAPAEPPPPETAKVIIEELEKARVETARNDAAMIQQATQLYQVQKSACPKTQAELVNERVLQKEKLDPWGNAYTLACRPDGSADVSSLGPDKTQGTPDDIVAKADG
jgi:hypothetical protein